MNRLWAPQKTQKPLWNHGPPTLPQLSFMSPIFPPFCCQCQATGAKFRSGNTPQERGTHPFCNRDGSLLASTGSPALTYNVPWTKYSSAWTVEMIPSSRTPMVRPHAGYWYVDLTFMGELKQTIWWFSSFLGIQSTPDAIKCVFQCCVLLDHILMRF